MDNKSTCGMESQKLQDIDSVKVGKEPALIQLEGVWQNPYINIINRDEMNWKDLVWEIFGEKSLGRPLILVI